MEYLYVMFKPRRLEFGLELDVVEERMPDMVICSRFNVAFAEDVSPNLKSELFHVDGANHDLDERRRFAILKTLEDNRYKFSMLNVPGECTINLYYNGTVYNNIKLEQEMTFLMVNALNHDYLTLGLNRNPNNQNLVLRVRLPMVLSLRQLFGKVPLPDNYPFYSDSAPRGRIDESNLRPEDFRSITINNEHGTLRADDYETLLV